MMKVQRTKGLGHFIASLRNSKDGIVAVVREDVAFRHELLLGIVHLPLACLVPMSCAMRLLLVVLWFIILTVELLNSAIEKIVDLVSPEWSLLAKRAKDYGSAAVFCLLLGLGVCWGVILWENVFR
jgi:diacylglycerol kinase (ATP)